MSERYRHPLPRLRDLHPSEREAPILDFWCDGCRVMVRQRGFVRLVGKHHLMFCSRECAETKRREWAAKGI